MKKLYFFFAALLFTNTFANATTHQVNLGGPNGNTFNPSTITIFAGDTVQWSNLGGFHNVNGNTGVFPGNPASFGNSTSSSAWNYSFVFTSPGTYNYQCDPHAGLGMTGTVTVLPAPAVSTVNFTTSSQSVSEGVGTVRISLSISPTTSSADTIIVTVTPGVGLDATDGTSTPPADQVTGEIILPLAAGTDSTFIDLNINDDNLVESSETASFDITYVSSGLAIGTSTNVSITILDNDAATPSCNDLFFSEYIEGSGNNKGLELFNPTPNTIDLTNYLVIESGNGGSFVDTLNLSGTLAPYATYRLCTDQADPIMLAVADTILSFPSVAHFNGDDALILWNGTDTLDVIGEPGVDPGSSWPVGLGSTQNHTLVRKINIQGGSLDWTSGANEWDVYPQNTFGLYGWHTFNPCGISTPVLSFASAAQLVDESAGTVSFDVGIANPDPNNATSVQVFVTGGTATSGQDYVFSSPTTVTFPAGSSALQPVSITIVDDNIAEGNELISFGLSNATNGGTIIGPTFFISILDNDVPIPMYSVADVTTNNAAVEPDSNGVFCSLEGVVLGGNLRSGGLQFTLHDGTGGIGTFADTPLNNYTVTEGDLVRVYGDVGFFNGLTQLYMDSVVLLTQGNPVPTPTVVTFLDETTESELVRIDNLTLVDPAQWTGTGSGFNVEVTDGLSTYDMRIDNDVDLYSQPAPSGPFHAIGIGGQFDFDSPYDEGYQFLPRSSADIISTIGIDEQRSEFKAYPVPFTNHLVIEVEKEAEIRVWGADGRLVYEAPISGTTKLNTSSWATGVYSMELRTEYGSSLRSIIKQ